MIRLTQDATAANVTEVIPLQEEYASSVETELEHMERTVMTDQTTESDVKLGAKLDLFQVSHVLVALHLQ